ncbi:MAG: site-specific DNA-methyltransferase [Candidatus Competibacteraceae bacterium]|nr:site-specific DNA-methyltransferase [Candidatus Competibacteraceae bacterium]
MFADPQLDYAQATQFYQHDIEWANRLITGDSLQVMTSLARREGLAGKVQMIYIDPPYGIKFSSNWQNEVGKRDVKDRDDDLTREPEMIKAYRDTWTLGVHSYLAYLKQRLLVARELLTDSGSVFVQISDENLHRVRSVLDETFGAENFVSVIVVKKTGGMGEGLIDNVSDYILWYARQRNSLRFSRLFTPKQLTSGVGERYSRVQLPDGQIRPITADEVDKPELLPEGSIVFLGGPMTSQTASESTSFEFDFEGRQLVLRKGGWKTNSKGFKRLALAERLLSTRDFINYKISFSDFPAIAVPNLWTDTMGTAEQNKVYVVQTTLKVIQRCLLMTTDPGDLVLDPTCGSGTTAYVAEQWGRRWITIDTSRVAIAIARQRLLTASFPTYKTSDYDIDMDGKAKANPASGFKYKTVPHITLKSIAQNAALDPIFAKHGPILADKLAALNDALVTHADEALRTELTDKLAAKMKSEGKNSISDADRRRWLLPGTSAKTVQHALAERKLKDTKLPDAIPPESYWREWEVPFDTDPNWPQALQNALIDYRKAWRAKMDEVNACIEANADQETLVDQPEEIKNAVRVCGPFTVESVRPLEESLKGYAEDDEDSPIGGASELLDTTFDDAGEVTGGDVSNAASHIDRMLKLLREDGLTLLGNKKIEFDRLDTIDNNFLHAEGTFTSEDGQEHFVAVVIGPEHGAVTGFQVEQAVRVAFRRGYDDLVFAGFSFDDAAQAAMQDTNDDGELRLHMAQIRPDVIMSDLLKKTDNSQLFTVFGQPRVTVKPQGDKFIVHMEGVDVYDPVKNSIEATKASKVAAWFLDSDYDGRTFCICQAFFPDKDAWKKLATALKGTIDAAALAAYSGTKSLPFTAGQHQRIAVKVIDPRGNEVMAVQRLETSVYSLSAQKA